MKQKGKKY